MKTVCKVCAHPERLTIEKALLAGHPSMKVLAAKYTLTPPCLFRHKANHLRNAMTTAMARLDRSHQNMLLARLSEIDGYLAEAARIVRETGDWRGFLGVVKGAQEQLALLGRVVGAAGFRDRAETVSIAAGGQAQVLITPHAPAQLEAGEPASDGQAGPD